MSGQKIVRIQECELLETNSSMPHERLSILRRILRLSREELLGEYDIPKTTLLSWEHGIKNISDQNLHRLLDIYLQEGLVATPEWVREGSGIGPHWVKDSAFGNQANNQANNKTGIEKNNRNPQIELPSEDTMFSQEALFFRGLSENSIALMVCTDDMAPYCYKGDMVGGRFKTGKEIKKCLNQPCIVRLKDGKDCIRVLVESLENYKNNKNLFSLICMNPAAVKDCPAVLADIEIEMAAPIIWRRQRE